MKSERKLQSNLYYRPPPHNGNLSTAATYFCPTQEICSYFSLLTVATSPQWLVNSVPRVAVVERFDCKGLSEEGDIFGSSSTHTGYNARTDHKTWCEFNVNSISSLPTRSISLLSNLMMLTVLQNCERNWWHWLRTYMHWITCTNILNCLTANGSFLRNFAVNDVGARAEKGVFLTS